MAETIRNVTQGGISIGNLGAERWKRLTDADAGAG
jgi:hypothetical protein